MTCSPDQSNFITPLRFGNSPLYPGVKSVEEIRYDMADDFAQRTLDSCRLVSTFVTIKIDQNESLNVNFFQRCSLSRRKSTFFRFDVWSTL